MSYDESEKKYKIIEAIQDYFEQFRERPLIDLFNCLENLTKIKVKNFILNALKVHCYKDTEKEQNDLALKSEIEESL